MTMHASKKSREKRLRAKYRKKIFTTAIIMLIIGLVVGFVGCVYAVRNSDRIGEILSLGVRSEEAAETELTAEPAADEPAFVAEPEATVEPLPVEAPSLTLIEENEAEEEAEAPEAEVFAEPVEEAEEELVIAMPEEAAEIEVVTVTEEPAAEAEPTAVPTEEPTAVPTEEPTPEPTAEPTEEPTPEPTAEPKAEAVIVPYGEAKTFKTQIKADGSARRAADADVYETIDLTLQVSAYKDPAYFEALYAKDYSLTGTEAAVEFQLTLNDYDGEADIIPQNFLLITFCGEDEDVFTQGYQLMDAEIAGNTGVTVTSDKTSTLFKRYSFSAEQGDMVYMVVTTYVDGVATPYWFEIISPEPIETPVPENYVGDGLTIGSEGEAVVKLQAKLIELKQLSGQPDGKFGSYTASAVKVMQKRYGMEPTGIADQAFLDKLYE